MSFLRGIFALNGFYALALMRTALRRLRASSRRPAAAMLGGWAALTALFIIVLSPFVAVRHVLLILPSTLAMLLVSGVVVPNRRALALTAALGLLVALGDYRMAAVYRDAPAQLSESLAERSGRTLFVGHWGFQHYAKSAGFSPYIANQSELSTCDVIIRPSIINQQAIDEGDLARLTLIEGRRAAATIFDVPRTMTPRLGHYTVWHGLPYTFTLEPVEIFGIYEVDADDCASSSAFATARGHGGIGPRIASARETSSTL